jgi:hypothetical protein
MESPAFLPESVRTLLSEAGLADEDGLAPVLVDLHRLGQAAPPAPSPQLAALLDAPPRRRPPRRRGAVVALVVAASIGTGITAAAADPQVREAAAHAVVSVVAPTIEVPAVELPTPADRPASSSAPAGRRTAAPPASRVVPSTGSAHQHSPGSPRKADPVKKKHVAAHESRRRVPGTEKPAKPSVVLVPRAAAARHASGTRTSD